MATTANAKEWAMAERVNDHAVAGHYNHQNNDDGTNLHMAATRGGQQEQTQPEAE